jgi:hypothetical protein
MTSKPSLTSTPASPVDAALPESDDDAAVTDDAGSIDAAPTDGDDAD